MAPAHFPSNIWDAWAEINRDIAELQALLDWTYTDPLDPEMCPDWMYWLMWEEQARLVHPGRNAMVMARVQMRACLADMGRVLEALHPHYIHQMVMFAHEALHGAIP